MAYKIIVLGASYGSLLGTKLIMAGHDVTLVCRAKTAELINSEGTEVRIMLRGEDNHRQILSGDQPGTLDASPPGDVDVAAYDMAALAMAEPQYGSDDIRDLLGRIAVARIPCLSIMNMPPPPYLDRIAGLDTKALEPAFNCPDVWANFDPQLVTLCSPDPQAFRLPDAGANVLQVGLPTNFKAARFADDTHNDMLRLLESDIAALRLGDHDVPVKLRVYDSLFVPLAKWSMLLTGNYRCVLADGEQSICNAVHNDIAASKAVYSHVEEVVCKLGADPADLVPFDKYTAAAKSLLKPSSVARSIAAGAENVERVDLLVKLISDQMGASHPGIDESVNLVNSRLSLNRNRVA